MAKISVLISSFLFFILETYGQPNKKDNTIIINESISLQKIKSVFFKKGYILDPITDSNLVSTQGRDLGKEAVSIKFSVLKEDSITYLKGQIKSNVSISLGTFGAEGGYNILYYGGMKGSGLRLGWEEMENIAKELSTLPLKYSK